VEEWLALKPKIGILIPEEIRTKVLPEGLIKRLKEFSDINIINFNKTTPEIAKEIIKEAYGCITGWGTCSITSDILQVAPNLKIVAHAAGSIKGLICSEGVSKGIRITSSASANGISVAEHALGLIITSIKRVCKLSDIMRSTEPNYNEKLQEEVKKIKALYDIKVGIVGAGYIGRYLIKLLKSFQVKVLLYDPYISEEEAKVMGVEKVEELNMLMAQVDVLSLHAPSIPETKHMINKDNLRLLKDDAVIINTARGALIDEMALHEEMKSGKFIAFLDVTSEEPIAFDNPLRTLPNVYITPHIAGALFNDAARIGSHAVDDLERFFKGQELMYEVNLKELEHRA
jgi:phosphoglycerate dehydrogenase-like enzyme